MAPAVMVGALPSDAAAFCRLTTSMEQRRCGEPCIRAGVPLAWPKPRSVLHLNERGSRFLAMPEVRDVVQTSFDAWAEVRCDEGPVGHVVDLAEETTAQDGAVSPGDFESDLNVFSFAGRSAWMAKDYDPRAYALTTVWFGVESGRIFGADMEVNEAFTARECPEEGCRPAVCPASGCQPGAGEYDILNVVTHEAGHYLGLAHTEPGGDETATMHCEAPLLETDKRTLEPDDVAGICAVYPADEGCGCRAVGAGRPAAGGVLGLGAALGLVLFWRRRRRD